MLAGLGSKLTLRLKKVLAGGESSIFERRPAGVVISVAPLPHGKKVMGSISNPNGPFFLT